jgi:hypothetical protein
VQAPRKILLIEDGVRINTATLKKQISVYFWLTIRMKLVFAAIFAVLAVSAFAEEPEWKEIDWASVVPVTDMVIIPQQF